MACNCSPFGKRANISLDDIANNYKEKINIINTEEPTQ